MRRGIAQGSARCMGTCQSESEEWQGSERARRNVWGTQWSLEMVCRSVQVTGVVQRVQRVWGRVCRWGRLTLATCDPPASFSISILEKPTGHVTNSNHVTTGWCSRSKCKPIAKHPNCDHMTTGVLGQPELRTSCNHYSFRADKLLNEW